MCFGSFSAASDRTTQYAHRHSHTDTECMKSNCISRTLIAPFLFSRFSLCARWVWVWNKCGKIVVSFVSVLTSSCSIMAIPNQFAIYLHKQSLLVTGEFQRYNYVRCHDQWSSILSLNLIYTWCTVDCAVVELKMKIWRIFGQMQIERLVRFHYNTKQHQQQMYTQYYMVMRSFDHIYKIASFSWNRATHKWTRFSRNTPPLRSRLRSISNRR